MTIAPTIETERLVLRQHRLEDFGDLAKVLASEHAQFMGGPMTRRAAWHSFCSDIAQWPLLGHGAWAVDRRDTGAFVGQMTLIKPPHFPEVEIGWMVFPQVEGKGYAFEATSAVRNFAYVNLGLQTIVSYIEKENIRSIQLAERLGATADSVAERPYLEDIVFRHPGPERLQ